MSFNLSIDLNNVEADSGGSVLPAGSYHCQVESSELKQTKDGQGHYFNVMFDVIGEKFNGRKIFHIFNIQNKSEKAQQIGLGQLKSMVVASGGEVTKITSADDIVGLECMVKVKIQNDPKYGESNRVVSFSPVPAERVPAEGENPSADDLPF